MCTTSTEGVSKTANFTSRIWECAVISRLSIQFNCKSKIVLFDDLESIHSDLILKSFVSANY